MKQDAPTGSWIDKTIQVILKICEIFCVILLAIIFVMTVVQVFRRVFSTPLLWSEELSRYLGIWLVMFSTCIAIVKRSHASIDIFTHKMSWKAQQSLVVFSDIIILLMSVYMSYGVYAMCGKFMGTLSTALKVPMGIVYIGVLIGWILCIITALYNLVLSIKKLAGGEPA